MNARGINVISHPSFPENIGQERKTQEYNSMFKKSFLSCGLLVLATDAAEEASTISTYTMIQFISLIYFFRSFRFETSAAIWSR